MYYNNIMQPYFAKMLQIGKIKLTLPVDSCSVTPYPSSAPTSHPFVSTHDTTSACTTARIVYFIWLESLKTATNSKGDLKCNKLCVNFICMLTSLDKFNSL